MRRSVGRSTKEGKLMEEDNCWEDGMSCTGQRAGLSLQNDFIPKRSGGKAECMGQNV